MTQQLGLLTEIVDAAVVARTAARLGARGVRLPSFAELARPHGIPQARRTALAAVGPDDADPRNLDRVHWYNAQDRRTLTDLPCHLELPEALTGVKARIVVLLGAPFPMITAHKVLAAYACLVPRLVTGQFDPAVHRAVWPSTGNYCRGGVAISRILGCRGVAVLPENMSRERFAWLEHWVSDPADIVRTPGSESNVKEIYDTCAALEKDPDNVIFNQFCEFGNYLAHRTITGPAAAHVFDHVKAGHPAANLFAFVAATGSAGTLAAGDHLKHHFGARIAAVEALGCPTLLYNGFGEHNIQGIGDKHVPLIHNAMNTDVVVGIDDRATDTLDLLFNTEIGQQYLIERRGLATALVDALPNLGLSGLCNSLAAIKIAKHFELGPDDVILTMATDGADLYASQRPAMLQRHFDGRFDAVAAGETWGRHMAGLGTDHLIELDHWARSRIFNLGYFTWVEQQGVSLEDFTKRRHQAFWDTLLTLVPAWDALITEFNQRTAR